MATELTTIKTWLYAKLADDAAGVGDRVYDSLAPRSATYPLVIFQFQGGHDTFGVGTARILSQGTWLVKGVEKAKGFGTLKTIAGTIDSLLHASSGTAGGGTVLACVREQPFMMVENQDGEEYRHLGGIYRILAQ